MPVLWIKFPFLLTLKVTELFYTYNILNNLTALIHTAINYANDAKVYKFAKKNYVSFH
jgi:hypothetical protein